MKLSPSQYNELLADFLGYVADECRRASKLHGPMRSMHEAWAVLHEEEREVWDEVRKKQPNKENLLTELTQVAAMAARMAIDCILADEAYQDQNQDQNQEEDDATR